MTNQTSDVSGFAKKLRVTVCKDHKHQPTGVAPSAFARKSWGNSHGCQEGLMPPEQFGIINLSKHISNSKPIQVALISGLKVSVLQHWSKEEVIVMLATQAVERMNLSEVIKAMTPEAMDW